MNTHEQLLVESMRLGTKQTAMKLSVTSSFIDSWFPRTRIDGKIDKGWEPSGGFIAASLAILRSVK